MKVRNILAPTDFSLSSGLALHHGASLAERFGATLHQLHVLTLHELEESLEAEDMPSPSPWLERADAAARARLDPGAEHAGELPTVGVRAVRRAVHAADAILEYAAEQDIDFIVMGRKGTSDLAHLLLGSVTERVIRHAPCPVLVVDEADGGFVDLESMAVRLRRVLLADDLSDKTPRALRYAVELLRPYAPELHAVHTVEIELPHVYGMGITSVFQVDNGLEPRLRGMIEGRLAELLPEGWELKVDLREGKAHRELPAAAEDLGADLLVLAGESHIDLEERLLGGTCERIARHAPCPTLIV